LPVRYEDQKTRFDKMSHAHGGRDLKRLRNTSGISDETVTQIIGWIAGRLGISQFDVECRSSQHAVAGRAYTTGARSYHGNRRPFVVLRIGTETIDRWKSGTRTSLRRRWLGSAHQETAVKVSRKRFPAIIRPYQYAHLKGKRYVLAIRMEALVYLAAHELRHLWQAARTRDDRKSATLPLYHGARGKFSEVDTEGFALTMLREYQRLEEG
jgi:hypothetical protein